MRRDFLGLWVDAATLGPTYERLSVLYEERGASDQAIDYANRLIELWQHADPELQPFVREARARIARLAGERP
jgi:hypothetical protein